MAELNDENVLGDAGLECVLDNFLEELNVSTKVVDQSELRLELHPDVFRFLSVSVGLVHLDLRA